MLGGRCAMGPGAVRIQQVKVPVSDLRRSVAWYQVAWYQRLLELDLMREFVHRGVLHTVVLADRQAGFLIGLQCRATVSGMPPLPDFDLFSIGVPLLAALRDLIARCESLDVACGELVDDGPDGIHVDVPDPDGTLVRFRTQFPADGPAFCGMEHHANGTVTIYDTPRLTATGRAHQRPH